MRSLVLSATLMAVLGLAPRVPADTRRPVERADQLPSHSYAVAMAPSALVRDDAGMTAFADSVRADLEADLAAYDIREPTALRSYYRALGTIAMLQHRTDDALRYEDLARPLEEKPAERMLSGMIVRALVTAERAGPSAAAQAFSAGLAMELSRVPYDSVQAELKTLRARAEFLSPAIVEGQVAAAIDPAARGGRISKDLALQLLELRYVLEDVLPHRDELVRQLAALIDAHRSEKPDIWGARDVSLEGRSGLKPVVIAISDVGVDDAQFPGRLWTNPKEIPANGKDDDRNGYVDDVHGIAWSLDGQPETGDLRPLDYPPAEVERGKQDMKGFLDMQAGLDSPEARDLKARIAKLPKEEVKPFLERVSFYRVYAHGTHVAGIALCGNPAGRVLVVRVAFPYRMVPPPPTAEWADGFARSLQRTVDYYRGAGVRVVNMSWGLSSAELEHSLEMNGAGGSQEERHRLAMECFETVKRGFRAAIASAPGILFVSAAGNGNESNQFNETVPAALDLPNTIAVGAVDRAGDEAAFTSFGKTDLYANGYEVESVLPGGDRQKWSGTSMASPQVVNLAAKLFAVHPELDARAVKRLILEGADAKNVSAGRSIRLMNEKRSFELAAGRP